MSLWAVFCLLRLRCFVIWYEVWKNLVKNFYSKSTALSNHLPLFKQHAVRYWSHLHEVQITSKRSTRSIESTRSTSTMSHLFLPKCSFFILLRARREGKDQSVIKSTTTVSVSVKVANYWWPIILVNYSQGTCLAAFIWL